MKKFFIFTAAFALLAVVSHDFTAQAAFKVIVNPANPETTLSKSRVSQLLLKKSARWDDGTNAMPIDLDSQSDVRDAMSRAVHGRSVTSIKGYWQRQIFSGKSVPPPEVGSDAEVVAFVAKHPGAIGYVSSAAPTDGVKVVKLTE